MRNYQLENSNQEFGSNLKISTLTIILSSNNISSTYSILRILANSNAPNND